MDMKIYVHVNICVFLRLRRVIPSVFSFSFYFFFLRAHAILRERMVNIQMETKTLFWYIYRFEYRSRDTFINKSKKTKDFATTFVVEHSNHVSLLD